MAGRTIGDVLRGLTDDAESSALLGAMHAALDAGDAQAIVVAHAQIVVQNRSWTHDGVIMELGRRGRIDVLVELLRQSWLGTCNAYDVLMYAQTAEQVDTVMPYTRLYWRCVAVRRYLSTDRRALAERILNAPPPMDNAQLDALDTAHCGMPLDSSDNESDTQHQRWLTERAAALLQSASASAADR